MCFDGTDGCLHPYFHGMQYHIGQDSEACGHAAARSSTQEGTLTKMSESRPRTTRTGASSMFFETVFDANIEQYDPCFDSHRKLQFFVSRFHLKIPFDVISHPQLSMKQKQLDTILGAELSVFHVNQHIGKRKMHSRVQNCENLVFEAL